MSDPIDIMALYPAAVTPADLAAWNTLGLQDFNILKAWYEPLLVGKVNIGTPQAPVWEDRYELVRYEPDPAMMSRELKLFQEAAKIGKAIPATRFYLTRTVSGLTVTPNSAWNVTSGNAVYNLATAYDGTALNAINGGFGSAGQKMLNKTFVSVPLLAQAIKGSINIQVQCKHDVNAPTDIVMQSLIFFRILNNNGSVAAEIASATSDTIPDNSASILNKNIIFSALNFSVTAGQRLCFGIGASYISGTGTARIRNNFGAQPSSLGADLPYGNNVNPGALSVPWVEFSQPLKFQ